MTKIENLEPGRPADYVFVGYAEETIFQYRPVQLELPYPEEDDGE